MLKKGLAECKNFYTFNEGFPINQPINSLNTIFSRSKMSGPAANKKFLEAIMLISDTKELWDINERYIV